MVAICRQDPPSVVEGLHPRFNIHRISLKAGNLAYILVVLMSLMMEAFHTDVILSGSCVVA